jgi:protein TonB
MKLLRRLTVIGVLFTSYMLRAQAVPEVNAPLDHDCSGIDTVFTIVEQMPRFPGGDAELFKYLGKAITYPRCPGEEVLPSTVRLTFVVRYDGVVCGVKLVSGFSCAEADEKWLSMVWSMPPWEPGKQRGEPVNVRYTLPVHITWR